VSRFRILAVVPARMASTRLPGKPLLPLAGRPIVSWVYSAAVESGLFDRVVVATDDDRIATAVDKFGGECLLTSPDLATGSERVAATAAALDDIFDVIVNVQGDQPFVGRADLAALVAPYHEGLTPEMTTVAAPLAPELVNDPSAVKVVTDIHGRALYFSRSTIPALADQGTPAGLLHHLGLYAFRADFMPIYARLAPTPLEQSEQLEQLRALEHGHTILVRCVDGMTIEVNTHDDYMRATAHVEEGPRV
jgi:3-deoxy-manno-octulosonate cytidylyltransferase (CMP-KDO synthetase)